MRCWCVYLSGARYRLFVYGPADATAIPKLHHILPHSNQDWFYLSGAVLPMLSWKKRPLNWCSNVVVVVANDLLSRASMPLQWSACYSTKNRHLVIFLKLLFLAGSVDKVI